MLSTETLNARNPSEVPATGDISGTPPAVNSRILGIPPELQAIILSHLTVADLRRLCLTSQHLRNAALPILYENLQLGLPHHRAFVRILEQLVNSRGLKYTKSICVMDSPYMGYYGLEEDDLRSDEGDSDSDGSDFDFDTQRPKSNIKAPDLSAMLNCLIRLVVGKIPQNKLRSFNGFGVAIMQFQKLNRLRECLRDQRLYEACIPPHHEIVGIAASLVAIRLHNVF
ncbi:MAG: hypothetical protein M1835_005115 [Candelina submexicana]|nr:MAG: hypothetical protein M1835_005115 [Candelina submexicana]